MNVLMIDNFDSFTYNLVDEFRVAGCTMKIYRNDLTMEDFSRFIDSFQPRLAVISPGPCSPLEAGQCLSFIREYYRKLPMFGICLGHQCLVSAFDGVVGRAPEAVHGKKSAIRHNGSVMFSGVPDPFYAGRYHSLIGSRIPAGFQVTADVDGLPMAIENREHRLFGVQFHPESILTTHGSRIIRNVLEAVR